MSFPPPPGFTARKLQETPVGDPAPSAQSPVKPGAALTEGETHHILTTTLTATQSSDPNILRFISSYLRCRNASQAATEAGLDARAGYNLLQRAEIFSAIQKITEKANMKYGFSAEEIVERAKEIAGIDPIEVERADGKGFKTSLKEIAPEARRAIKKFKARNTYFLDPNGQRAVDPRTGEVMIETEIIEVEFWDKTKNIELLGREKDLFKETKKVEHDVTSNMRNFMLESVERSQLRWAEAREVKELKPPEGNET